MAQFKNLMEIFTLLDKSNCRKCNEKTCMAFAAAVFMGKKELAECPQLSLQVISENNVQAPQSDALADDFDRIVRDLKTGLRTMDLAEKAETIGASYADGRLSLKIMGKDFSIDEQSKVYTDLHVNPWILVSSLYYITHCKGTPLTSNWVPLRELPGGQDWYRLFGQQCENQLKKSADFHPALFADLVQMFGAKQVASSFDSDVAVILFPLPFIPMLICYWEPEDGMDSSLNLFFDSTACDNFGMDGLFLLGSGFARMLKNMILQHGSLKTRMGVSVGKSAGITV